jgi:hypothetical protein
VVAAIVVKNPKHTNNPIAHEIFIHFRESICQRFDFLVKPPDNLPDGFALPGVKKARSPKIPHCTLQIKAKVTKFLAMMHAIIFKSDVDCSNISLASFLDLGFFLSQRIDSIAKIYTHILQFFIARAQSALAPLRLHDFQSCLFKLHP